MVFHRQGREFVRVLSPVDLRRAARLPDEVVARFAGARTGSDAQDFWTLARQTHESLSRQRTPNALKAGSAALAEHPPTSRRAAEVVMTVATADGIQIANLGVAAPGPRSRA